MDSRHKTICPPSGGKGDDIWIIEQGKLGLGWWGPIGAVLAKPGHTSAEGVEIVYNPSAFVLFVFILRSKLPTKVAITF